MIRVPRSQAATLSATFYSAGAPSNLDAAPTVTVTREDGTALTSGTATSAGAGVYEFALTGAHLAELDVLSVVWEGLRAGKAQRAVDEVHVVGQHFFTLAEMRALEPLDDQTKYPDAKLAAMRDQAAFALEHACGVAFCPSYRRRIFIGTGRLDLALGLPRVLSVQAVTIDDQVIDPTELETLILQPGGKLRREARWTRGAEIEVKLTHGYPFCPPQVAHAALKLARHVAFADRDSGIPERATSFATESGDFRLVTPGLAGQLFELPEVNSVVQRFDHSVSALG